MPARSGHDRRQFIGADRLLRKCSRRAAPQDRLAKSARFLGRYGFEMKGVRTRRVAWDANPFRSGHLRNFIGRCQPRLAMHLDQRSGTRPRSTKAGSIPAPAARAPATAPPARRLAERDERDHALALAVHSDQRLELRIDECRDDFRADSFGRRRGEQIREDRSRVPEAIAVRARAILPCAAPENRGQRDQARAFANRRPLRCRMCDVTRANRRAAALPSANPPAKSDKAPSPSPRHRPPPCRFRSGKARPPRPPRGNDSPRHRPLLPRQTIGAEQYPRQRRGRRLAPIRRPYAMRRQRGHRGKFDVARQRHRSGFRINLVGHGDCPNRAHAATTHAGVRMLGDLVKDARRFDVVVAQLFPPKPYRSFKLTGSAASSCYTEF